MKEREEEGPIVRAEDREAETTVGYNEKAIFFTWKY
jgi:hypothetical protein